MVVTASAYVALVAVLGFAAVSKARDLRAFAGDITGYGLLPDIVLAPAPMQAGCGEDFNDVMQRMTGLLVGAVF
ncbi:hypothetical protein ABZ297_25675, partial [Nonomuraea sp. NPDC005983]|uniref:hypothetical protein n=1 Tax=Nonomuraea sp. NPDC005983 TaxID=3155595 RepID=UPI0033BB3C1C